MSLSAAAPVYEEAQMAQAEVSQELGSVTFEVPSAMTVLSDNRLYKSSVKTESFVCELDYEATPKLSPYAFIHSRITNDKEYLLANGELNLFMNEDYVGKSFIKPVGPGETFDVYLGIDEEIKVKRTELIDKRKKKLLGIRTRKDYGYKIEIESYKKKRVKIAIYDQLPVSKNADIKSELSSSSPKPSEVKDLGILKWDFELSPKEKKTLEFEFFVEYPSDKSVSGI
jgi:uncharacterized protein (TIGR02231 family)